MKKIIQKGLAIGALATTGLAATASGAFAQAAPADATINFTGTVGSVCLFSNTVNGTLEYDGSRLEAPPSGAAGPGTGTPGFVDLDCTAGVNISVSLPQDNGSTTDLISTADAYGAFVEVDAGGLPTTGAFNEFFGGSSTSSSTGFISGPFSDTLEVAMYVEPAGSPPEGAYNYNVVVTATPQ